TAQTPLRKGRLSLSWNMRELNSPVKRTRCLEFLRRKDVSIRSLTLSVDSIGKDDCGRFVYAATRINHTKSLILQTHGVLKMVILKPKHFILPITSRFLGLIIFWSILLWSNTSVLLIFCLF
uniref:Uncharacterized protein n=1 Tax=Sinocyclocheilus rhinocerous TaxID=307959 RepID=A0A673G7W7_9TELE